MTNSAFPLHHRHFIPIGAGLRGTGLGCMCREKRGMGTVTQSIESALAPIVAGPAALYSAVTYNPGGAPGQHSVAASAAAGQGDILGTIGNLIDQAVQNVKNLAANAFSPTLITGGSPLTQNQVDAIKQNTYAQIDQAAAGNTQLANQAKAQASSEIDSAINLPPAVTIPSISDLTSGAAGALSGISWQTWAIIAVAGIAGILVLKQVLQ